MNKLLITTIILIGSLAQAGGGGGSTSTCVDRTVLNCQSSDGQSLITVYRSFCYDDTYGDYHNGYGLRVNAPAGLLEGKVEYSDDKTAWKLSSLETGKPYEINGTAYNIELYVDGKFRGPLRIENAKDKSLLIDSLIICR